MGLQVEGDQALRGPTATGTGGPSEEELARLSTLIEVINEQFGTDFDAQDLIDAAMADLKANELMQHAAANNDTFDDFRGIGDDELMKVVMGRYTEHSKFINGVLGDDQRKEFFLKTILWKLYQELREAS